MVKIWGWLGVILLAAGAALLIWRASVGSPPRPEGAPTSAAERIDRYEILGSLGLVIGGGILGAALPRREDPEGEPSRS